MSNDFFSEIRLLLAAPAGGDKNHNGDRGWHKPKSTGKRTIGRPQKYALVLWSLDDEELYTAATVANRAIQLRLIDTSSAGRVSLARQRIRIAMGRYVNNHDFPDNGDGNVRLKGQAPTPGWLGRRWKEHADALNESQYRQLVNLLAEAQVPNRDRLLNRVRRLDPS